MPFYSLMRWPVLLLAIGLILVILLVLPPPGEWIDRVLSYEFVEQIKFAPAGK